MQGFIDQMSKIIQLLEKQLTKVTKTLNDFNSKVFQCEICEYQASSDTVLKAHMTRKHKLKKLRLISTPDDSLKLSPPASIPE